MNDNDIDADPEMVFLCGIMGFFFVAVFSKLMELNLYVYAIIAATVAMMNISFVLVSVERKLQKEKVNGVSKG